MFLQFLAYIPGMCGSESDETRFYTWRHARAAARVSGKRRNVTHPFDLSSYCLRSVSEHVGKAVNQRFWNGNLVVSARNIQEIHKG